MSQPWSIPVNWAWATMGEISRVVGGGTPDTRTPGYFGGDIGWVTPADLSGYSSKHISRGARSLTREGLENSGAQLMPPRALLFSSRAPIGYVALASNEVSTNQGFKSFVLDDGLLPDFYYYYLQYAKPLALHRASGTTFLEISSKNASTIPAVVAPVREQHRIVDSLEELLSDLDAGVAALERVKAKLALYRASVLKAAVDGTLTVEWRAQHPEVEPASTLLERILLERRRRWEERQLAKFKAKAQEPPKNWKAKYAEPAAPDTSRLPPLPDGWFWAALDQIAELAGGVTKGQKFSPIERTRMVPYLRVANVQQGLLDLTKIKEIRATEADIAALRLIPGDVLFNEGGDRDKLGRGWVWEGQIAECVHQNHVFRARPVLPELQPKLLSWCGNSYGREWFMKAGRQSVNLASINLTVLRSFPVALAPALEQEAVLEATEDQMSVIDHVEADIEAKLKSAQALRQAILRHAFTGQLVPQDPNDEPASELLKRIAAERVARAHEAVTARRRSKRAPGTRRSRRPARS